ncbi:hypothetical protein, partial [Bradyrhizobium sp. AS23.2]|uniref:hypothetical protein n=1 Tax=Bradyrhizobium sp. AS23.2 TaxID=1680155 RepID=UPI001AD7F47F
IDALAALSAVLDLALKDRTPSAVRVPGAYVVPWRLYTQKTALHLRDTVSAHLAGRCRHRSWTN